MAQKAQFMTCLENNLDHRAVPGFPDFRNISIAVIVMENFVSKNPAAIGRLCGLAVALVISPGLEAIGHRTYNPQTVPVYFPEEK